MGVGQLFSMYFEGNTFMVALEKDEAGMVSGLASLVKIISPYVQLCSLIGQESH